jgi:cytidyltransferase-like protein
MKSNRKSPKKVFVSGCFDMLHSGHFRFLEEAAGFGDLYVAIASDQTICGLKGRAPVSSQAERHYMIQAVKYVKECFISSGSGVLDFLAELDRVDPNVFVVNEDGNTLTKAELCRQRGIEYVVLKRQPWGSLPARTSVSLRKECRIPYRLDLAGGWLDQPFVSKFAAGPVLTISVEPVIEFNERSGMSSSSRRRAIELWETELPGGGDWEKLARLLFTYENPPGTKLFTGSQDAIGIVFPGLNRLDYRGQYWPEKITPHLDESVLAWLERHLYMVPLGQRKGAYDVFKGRSITTAKARALSVAADACWQAILSKDLAEFGRQMRAAFEAQVAMFPQMSNADVRKAIRHYSQTAAGWKLSGAGGGGYLVLVSAEPVPGAIQLKIRRSGF